MAPAPRSPGGGQHTPGIGADRGGSGGGAAIDWVAAERSPEFRQLIAKRRSFVLPATIGFFVVFFGFILLASYAKEFMGQQIVEGFTVGYLLALINIVMVWVLCALYVRMATKTFDPLSRAAAETALRAGGGGTLRRDGGVEHGHEAAGEHERSSR